MGAEGMGRRAGRQAAGRQSHRAGRQAKGRA